MRVLRAIGLSWAVLAGAAAGSPVLETAPAPAGPWSADEQATIVLREDGQHEAVTALELGSVARFYRAIVAEGGASVRVWSIAVEEGQMSILMRVAPLGMVLIPGGPFEMGDALNEGYFHELPVHTVPVSAFYLEECEVTKALWDEVRSWAVNHGYTLHPEHGIGVGETHPVSSVSWDDAAKWCNARSEKDGLEPCYYTSAEQTEVYRTGHLDFLEDWVKWGANGYRLPTEAEWEKAARGGLAGKRYSWGDTIEGTQANYVNSGDPWDNGTSPTGLYPANGYGLYDMTGNIAEWVWDGYDSGWYARPEASAADTHGPVPGSGRVFRGGSWGDHPEGQGSGHSALRCASRLFGWSYELEPGLLGFRCARGRF